MNLWGLTWRLEVNRNAAGERSRRALATASFSASSPAERPTSSLCIGKAYRDVNSGQNLSLPLVPARTIVCLQFLSVSRFPASQCQDKWLLFQVWPVFYPESLKFSARYQHKELFAHLLREYGCGMIRPIKLAPFKLLILSGKHLPLETLNSDLNCSQ